MALAQILSLLLSDASGHLYTESFPTNDNYDVLAIDPETPYGTPYGGFSRATASRLASLPLKLPDVGEDLNEFEAMYTTVRDSQGRPFVCRVYHEDELEPSSLKDSIFNTPKLKDTQPPIEEGSKETSDRNLNTLSTGNSGHDNRDASAAVVDPTTGHSQGVDEHTTKSSNSDKNAVDTKPEMSNLIKDPIRVVHEVHHRLQQLSGLCAQLHPNWWSYEWCYLEKVTQFHVQIDVANKKGDTQAIRLEDITSLGSYSERRIELTPKSGSRHHTTANNVKFDLAEGKKELARVIDTFVGGDICPETGKPRVSESTLRCCSEKVISKTRGGILKNGIPIATDLLTIVETAEWSESVCHYNFTLCTPLLCDDESVSTKNSESSSSSVSSLGKKIFGTGAKTGINLELDPAEIEKMSVAEVLGQTFGKSGDFCIQTGTGGWWVYEFCPGEYIRQFHETSLMDRMTGATSTAVETEHILGRFVPEDYAWVSKENEWKNVVNVTEIDFGSGTKSSNKKKNLIFKASGRGGNGAYYTQEYTKGDLCDHEDVTDSAVKAGEFGEGGIERATSVRYSCGTYLEMTVKEDSTCHYIVEITVPTLCHHPLFRAPVSKKQVVKCIPMP
jgi:hypothetical protein